MPILSQSQRWKIDQKVSCHIVGKLFLCEKDHFADFRDIYLIPIRGVQHPKKYKNTKITGISWTVMTWSLLVEHIVALRGLSIDKLLFPKNKLHVTLTSHYRTCLGPCIFKKSCDNSMHIIKVWFFKALIYKIIMVL